MTGGGVATNHCDQERPVGIWEWGFLYKESRGADPRHQEGAHMSSW